MPKAIAEAVATDAHEMAPSEDAVREARRRGVVAVEAYEDQGTFRVQTRYDRSRQISTLLFSSSSR